MIFSDVQRHLAELVRQLDVRQDQVLVEAIIVEVSNDVARKLGLQLLLGGKDIPFAATNFSNAAPNIVTLAGGVKVWPAGTVTEVGGVPGGAFTGV